MGMAASQARFLGLTARKNNVEFEGQQINQQRTTLANQTANYYNDLLGMQVPTPPSVDNFTKTVYSFNDGALTNQITALIAKDGGAGYSVSYLQQHEDDFTPVKDGMAVVTEDEDGKFFIGNAELRELADTDDDDLKEEEEAYEKLLDAKYGGDKDEATWLVRYVENTTTGEMEPKFYNKKEVEDAIKDESTGQSLSSITVYKMGSATVTEEIKNVPAKLEKDSTGRYINITLNPEATNEVTYSLTTSTVTDQDAYEDAMNQYEFDKNKYEQQVQEINAKIEIVQAQDKNLELRLKQLDTEQKAISNEMDAVSSVVQKNVEASFKTFG